jgi:phosphoribosylaminoimidazole carboxylase (NCAIR synthetase)
MLHFDSLNPGSRLDLQEVASHLNVQNSEFEILAIRRLEMRRDVHSIEEAATVLRVQRDRLRDRNLPQAISLAEKEYSLIKERLALNPHFPSLRLTETSSFNLPMPKIKHLWPVKQ